MKQQQILPTLLVVAGLAVGATGCGGGVLSAKELRKQADEICKRVTDESSKVESPTEPAGIADAAPALVAITERGLADLKELVPSAADKVTMSELTELIESTNRHLNEAGQQAAAKDDAKASEALTGANDDLAEFESVAKEAGFGACATLVSASAAAAADDDGVAGDAGSTDPGAPTLPAMDLGVDLNPITGYEYEPLTQDAVDALLEPLSSSEEVTGIVQAVGTTLVKDATGTSLLIFLGLNRALEADETQSLVDAITAGGTNLETGDAAGATGWAYVSADGQQGFVTVRAQTVIIGLSPAREHLASVLKGLFEANPDL